MMALIQIRELAGLAFFLAMLLVSLVVLRNVTKRPLAVLWPISFGMVIVVETVLLNLLSLFHIVALIPVLFGNCVLMGFGAWFLIRGGSGLAGLGSVLKRIAGVLVSKCHSWRVEWMIVPLGLMVLMTACAYPPSTFDSMTYHLARVGHWIQARSIDFYATPIDRQNWMQPGAEYLILVLQVISGTDRWANLVQFAAWIHILFAIPALCRMAGVPARMAPWCAVLVAAIPMGALQASSTQTDMVASTLAVAIVSACLPLLHRGSRWRLKEVVILACMICGGWLVKPTSLLAACPFLVTVVCIGLMNAAGRGTGFRCRGRGNSWITLGLSAVLVAGVVMGPHVVRFVKYSTSPEYLNSRAHPCYWTYKAVGQWPERLVNIVDATYAQHTLGREKIPAALRSLLGRAGVKVEGPRVEHKVFLVNEDFIGNPFHMAMFVALAAWVVVFWRWLPGRGRLFALVPVLSWIIMHLFIRDQAWISRLQLPIFVLMPVMWGAALHGRRGLKGRAALLVGVAVVAMAYAYTCVANNGRKVLTMDALRDVDREFFYYLHHDISSIDDEVLEIARQRKVKRLGLMIGFSDYEYPLLRRAMMQGLEVQHILGPSSWPELIYSNQGVPEATDAAVVWLPLGTNGVYYPARL